MATSWSIIVNFLLPPPLVLVSLLVMPLPRVFRKGLLQFTHRFLSLVVVGTIELVHLMIAITGLCLLATTSETYKLSQQVTDVTLTANQQTSIRAKKWREERNFWIAAITFILWCILSQLYKLGHQLVRLQDENKELRAQLELERQAEGPPAGGVAAAEAEGLRQRK